VNFAFSRSVPSTDYSPTNQLGTASKNTLGPDKLLRHKSYQGIETLPKLLTTLFLQRSHLRCKTLNKNHATEQRAGVSGPYECTYSPTNPDFHGLVVVHSLFDSPIKTVPSSIDLYSTHHPTQVRQHKRQRYDATTIVQKRQYVRRVHIYKYMSRSRA
jgi:hypothetical protein